MNNEIIDFKNTLIEELKDLLIEYENNKSVIDEICKRYIIINCINSIKVQDMQIDFCNSLKDIDMTKVMNNVDLNSLFGGE